MPAASVQRGAERRRFAQSSLRDQCLMLTMMLSQAACQKLLGRVRTQTLTRLGATTARLYRKSPLPAPEAERVIARAEIVKSLQIWQAECVAESLILWTWLRAGDHPAKIRVGLRHIFGEVEAHMWVELHGKALLDLDHEIDTWHAFDEPFAT